MSLFVRVAELGSFSAAASQLGVARSVVTRQIAALEEHLGIKLMVRSTRRLSLTSAGSAYLEKCRVILELVEEAEAPPWSFLVEGQLRSFYLPLRLQANNGDALAEAAAQGLGIALLPDFIAADYLATGKLETVLEAFEPPQLGIYSVLPSNRYMPQRVRVLIELLSSRLGVAA